MKNKNLALRNFSSYKGSEYFTTACKYFMAFVLTASGIAKIISPLRVINTTTSLFNIEENLAIFLITLLPLAEITLAILLLTNKKQKLILIYTEKNT